ncbi:MAG: DUF721 domain-containing protein [Muribaculaceae bacterium]|jgi:hypothetical protein|nr:DUF721 domain-containing protein [Muribaculaceae bacterium]
MKRTEPEQIGEVINALLKADNLDVKLDEQRISAVWPDVVGMGVNRYTIERYVKQGTLYVRLSSASLRNELMLCRTSLISRLNEAVGRQVINNITFY